MLDAQLQPCKACLGVLLGLSFPSVKRGWLFLAVCMTQCCQTGTQEQGACAERSKWVTLATQSP